MKKKPLSASRIHQGAPLQSWDVFLDAYFFNLQLAEDNSWLEDFASENHWKHNFDFELELFRLHNTIIVTDPSIRIVYASSNIYHMNGYLPGEVLGKKPSIFQGQGTCPDQKSRIREAIDARKPFETVLVNYRKNKEPYECLIRSSPVFDRSGRLAHFIAFESERQRDGNRQ